MKRQISIITYLLGAFAAGLASQTGAATTQTVSGGYYYYEGTYKGTRSLDRMYVEGMPTSYTANLAEGEKDAFVAVPPPAMVVSGWGIAASGTAVQKISEWIDAASLSDPAKYPWSGKPSDGARYLAVNFAYIPLDITFNGGDGGSGSMAKMTGLNIDSAFTLSANAFEKAGYHFTGWKTNATKGVIFADRAALKGSAFWNGKAFDSTLYAQWAANTYTVTFNGNGGGAPSPTSKTVTYDSTYGDLPTCEREGWQFKGWYTAMDGGSKIEPTTKVTIVSDQILYAQWTQKYKVTFYESTLFDKGKVLKDEWVLAGGDATPPAHPVHEGYTPDGWSETYTNVRADKDVWAKYTANPYSVKFHANDGSGRTTTQPFQYGEEKGLLSDPLPRKGYVLEGWSKDESSSTVDYKPGALVSNLATGGTVDLYALWTPISYTVAFDANGGGGDMDSVSLTYDTLFTVPECEFAKTGCEFRSWSATVGGVATNFEAGAVVSNLTSEVDATVTFRAEWTGYYTVAFDANGGTGTMTNLTYETGVEYALPSNAYTKIGYRFYGWATSLADAVALKKPAYTNGQAVVDLAATGDTRTLFAEWTTNRYTVVFNPNGTGVKGKMEAQDFFYDQVKPLSPNRFTRGELWSFGGWSNSVGRVFTDEESVSNLCADDGGTFELFARWTSEIGPLSEAMGCDNLKWESEMDPIREQPLWEVCDSEGSDGPPCVQQVDGYWTRMYAHITTNGVLTFKVKLTTANDKLVVNIGQHPDMDPIMGETLTVPYQEGVEWQDVVVEVPKLIWDSAYIRIYHWNDYESGTAFVDQMTWTPEGAHPEPKDGEDNVTISTAAVSADGKSFSLSFDSKAEFDYNLLTNANLLIKSWGIMETKEGTGETITFEPEIIEGQPQMFYKVETIKKE